VPLSLKADGDVNCDANSGCAVGVGPPCSVIAIVDNVADVVAVAVAFSLQFI